MSTKIEGSEEEIPVMVYLREKQDSRGISESLVMDLSYEKGKTTLGGCWQRLRLRMRESKVQELSTLYTILGDMTMTVTTLTHTHGKKI